MRKAAGMKQRIFCTVLAAAVLFSQENFESLAAEGDGAVHIHNEDEFYLFTEQCRTESFSEDKVFHLESDLNLSEYDGLFVPVMAGTFDGNGHTITGLSLTEEMSDYGLFRYISEEGTVRNLTVEAEVLGGEEQENIGILAGSNAGTIENCVSRGNLNAEKSVGGIAGMNEETGVIRNSENEAQVDGKDATGGIAGTSEGTIESCTNSGKINTNQKVQKKMDGDGSVTVSIPNAVTGLVADDRANETGGIAGNSSGTIAYCKNTGTVGYEHLGSSTGGIAGRQDGSLAWCSNEGTVYGRKDVGGIVGYFEPYEEAAYDRDYSDELSDQLDELSDLMDDLGDSAEKLGDNMSGNMDELSDKLKALKDSVRNHLDDFGDLADDSKDAISDQVDDVKNALEGVKLDVNLNQLNGHVEQIQKDMDQMRTILKGLSGYLADADGEVKDSINQIIGQYEEKLSDLEHALEELKQYLAGQAGGGSDNGGEEEPPVPEEGGETVDTPTEDGDTSAPEEPKDNGSIADGGSVSDGEQTAPDGNGGTDGKEASDDAAGPDEEKTTEQSDTPEETTDASPESDSDTGAETEAPSGDTGSDSASLGRMQMVAFTTVSVTDEDAAEIAAAVQELTRLGEDIRTESQAIADILGGLPGELSGLQSNFQKLGDNISDLTDTLSDELDSWSDELDDIKDDIRAQGDSISDSVDQTTDTLDADWDELSDRLDRVKDKFGDIRAVISDTFDELKNRIDDRSVYVDISELADHTPGDGKVVSCTNLGEIIADSQAGGIVGSITKVSSSDARNWFFDNSSDEDDEDEDEKDSITKHVSALVTGCKNESQVTIQDDYAGGIVGKADYGLVDACENYGDILSEDGGYVGGIAGKSELAIRDSYVLCGLMGDSYVGGAAGSGEDISGSYLCVYMDMEDHVKSSGAVAGKADGTVEGNYFVDNGYGAVDDITRSEEAVGMDYASMLELGKMPREFSVFTVRFQDGDETVWEGTFSYGDELSWEDYPALTEPEGEYAYWEDKHISPVHRNVTVHAVYRVHIPSLAPEPDEGEEHPPVLLGGSFYPDSALAVRKLSDEEKEEIARNLAEKNLLSGYVLKDIYSYEISQEEPLNDQMSLRVKDDSALADSLMTLSEELEVTGKAQKAERVGSYLGIQTTVGQKGYLVVLDRTDKWMAAAMAAGAAAVVILLFAIWYRRRKKKKATDQKKEEESA